MTTVSPERKIGDYPIGSLFLGTVWTLLMSFFNKQERRENDFHFSFGGKHVWEGEVEGGKDLFWILTFLFNMKILSKADK